jgi:hypothetical protein
MDAAERMRRYRARQLRRGVDRDGRRDPHVAAVRFAASSLLTPGERDVVRRFIAGLKRLPVRPSRVAIFGSRARGGSRIDSDVDVAVFMPAVGATLQERVLAAAARAQAPYAVAGAAIVLRPVVLPDRPRGAFHEGIRNDLEIVWTRPS